MTILTFLLAAGLAHAHAGIAGGTTSCPSDDPGLHDAVRYALTDPRIRSAVGMTEIDPSHLRALADPADASTCQRLATLATAAPGGSSHPTWSYYTADGWHFAAVASNVEGGHGGIYVYDAAWNLKEVMFL